MQLNMLHDPYDICIDSAGKYVCFLRLLLISYAEISNKLGNEL